MLRPFAEDLEAGRANAARDAVRRRRARSPWFGRKYSSIEDERAAYIDALQRWGQQLGGEAPARADWSHARDPDGHWPRSDRVASAFHWCDCAQSRVQKYLTVRIDPDEEDLPDTLRASLLLNIGDAFVENPEYPRECTCPSGWQRAIATAGLAPATGRNRTTRSEMSRFGRTRQMVTGGQSDTRPVPWSRGVRGIEQIPGAHR